MPRRSLVFARALAIWACGLIGSGILGSLLDVYARQGSIDAGPVGFIGGVLLFACIRLWSKEPPKIQAEATRTG